MIQLLKSLFGDTDREAPAKKPASGASPRPKQLARDYRAVSLASNSSCTAARQGPGTRRYLLREAPRLPLADCPTPASCTCRFLKYADRRDDDRRLLGETETGRWYAGTERRRRKGRRSAN